MRRSTLTALLTSLTLAVGAVAAPTASAAQPYQRYVALGDSFAAVGTLTKIRTDPIGCAKSTDNYPSGVAAALGVAAFVDISCGGAQTKDMTAPQDVAFGPNPPQFSALTADTDLVTLSIGGNDVGFGEIITTCAQLSFTNPFGAPCKANFNATGTDALLARIADLAPKITEVVEGVKARAPKARIVVVGYLRILPPQHGCWPLVPMAVGDVPWLNTVQHTLNTTIGERARAAGAIFVNPGTTTGHDVCQLPWNKWVEGLIPTSLSVPVHPNAAGQRHVAGLVAAALRG